MHTRLRQPATKLFPWGSSELDMYEAEPACPFAPTADGSIADAQGRLWGRHNGKECVFKGAGGGGSAAQQQRSVPLLKWATAVVCKAAATNANSVVDAQGKLWGWESGRSCAHRSAAAAAFAAKSGATARGSDRMTVVWEAAPGCRAVPTAANTIADKFGRLWSWEDGTTCAFKA